MIKVAVSTAKVIEMASLSKWLGHPHTLIDMQLLLASPSNYPTQVPQSGYGCQNTSEDLRPGDSLPFSRLSSMSVPRDLTATAAKNIKDFSEEWKLLFFERKKKASRGECGTVII